MKKRLVMQKEIEEAKLNFFADMELDVKTQDELENYLENNNLKLETVEDENLIYFKLLQEGEPVMFSRPLMKYIQELESELKFLMKDGICLYESQIPLHEYGKIRNGLVTKVELAEREEFGRKLRAGILKVRPMMEVCFGDVEQGWLLAHLPLFAEKGYLEHRVNEIADERTKKHMENIIANIRDKRKIINLGDLNFDKGCVSKIDDVKDRTKWLSLFLKGAFAGFKNKKIIKEKKNEIKNLLEYAVKEREIRIWHNENAPSTCGFLYLLNLLKDKNCTIYEVRISSKIKDRRSGEEKFIQTFGYVDDLEFISALKFEKELSKDDIENYLREWENIIRENKEMRILQDGKLKGVNINYFDERMLENVPDEKEFKIVKWIGRVIGSEEHHIDSWFIESRIDEFIKQGKYRVVKKQEKNELSFHRIIEKIV